MVVLMQAVSDRTSERMLDVRIVDAMLAGTRKDLHIVKLVLTIYTAGVKRESVERKPIHTSVENPSGETQN